MNPNETPGTGHQSNHNVVLPLFSQAVQEGPQRKYRTIVADPPWRYNVKPPEGGTPYPTMTTDELVNLPVGLWGGADAHLYLWTTNSFLVDAHKIMAAWGFEYKTLLTWIKRRPPTEMRRDPDRWIGMGYYYRGVTEHVLFGVRGSLKLRRNDLANIFYAPRREHSEKPSAFYDLVESASPGPYLDVFARTLRFNWDSWGNEVYAVPGLPEVGVKL